MEQFLATALPFFLLVLMSAITGACLIYVLEKVSTGLGPPLLALLLVAMSLVPLLIGALFWSDGLDRFTALIVATCSAFAGFIGQNLFVLWLAWYRNRPVPPPEDAQALQG